MLYKSRKNFLTKIKETFGMAPTGFEMEETKERMDCISVYHRELKERNELEDVDEVTWDDLQMDEIFLRMNHTKSYMGEQVLYHKLHCRNTDEACWIDFEKQISFYMEHPGERISIEEKLCRIGKRKEDYYMPVFLMNAGLWNIPNGILMHILQILLAVCVVGAIASGQLLFVAALIIVALINLVIYLAAKQKYEVFLYSLGSLRNLLQFCRTVASDKYRLSLSVPEEIILISEELKGLSRRIIGWQGRKYAAVSGDIMSLFQDYLFGITLLDISLFNHIMRQIDKKQEQILKLFEFAGQIDMGISIASYRRSLPFYCQPEIRNRHEFCIKNLVHPLIGNAVGNDFTLQHRAVITGANASGKSTFMKALAINTILAQTIHTCTAEAFCLPPAGVMTSMNVRDNVLERESYYVREAKRIRGMIELCGKEQPMLFVLDEVLRGTNTSERLAASFAILDYFTKCSCFVVTSTHDLDLADEIASRYDPYYFKSTVRDGDISFDYCIRRGKGGNSNAIELLSLLEYPEEIITAARDRQGA